jgi:hypothetical protein
MRRHLFTTTLLGAFVWAGLALSPLSTYGSDKNTSATVRTAGTSTVQIEDLNPFSQLAYIPAGADLSTLRFEKVRMVRVPSKIRYTADENCQAPGYREPGGSSECTHRQIVSTVLAYEVTYSYRGQPMASDEYGDTYYTLHVYFRPDQLDAAEQRAASTRKQNGAETSGYFALSTYREPVQRTVIDEGRSTLCDRNVLDGDWAQSDATCVDNTSYMTSVAPSDYITVKINPNSPGEGGMASSHR